MDNAPIVSHKQQESTHIRFNVTTRNSERPVEACSCAPNVQNLLFTSMDTSSLSFLIYALFVWLFFIKAEKLNSEKRVFIDFLTIIQGPIFDAYLSQIEVWSKTCCKTIFGRKKRTYKQKLDAQRTSDS